MKLFGPVQLYDVAPEHVKFKLLPSFTGLLLPTVRVGALFKVTPDVIHEGEFTKVPP